MSDHLAALEKARKVVSSERHRRYATGWMDTDELDALLTEMDAAIALMRGQSEVVIRLPELPEQDVEGVRFDGFSISAMEDFARRAVAMNERSCVWTIDADPYAEMWNGACGIAWTFTEGGPADNECNHCPKCGGRIEATEQPKDTADEQ